MKHGKDFQDQNQYYCLNSLKCQMFASRKSNWRLGHKNELMSRPGNKRQKEI